MLNLQKGIISLYRKVTTSLPPDVEEALKQAAGKEGKEAAKNELLTVINGVQRSRSDKTPICMDLGVPFFYVSAPKGISHAELTKTIVEATRDATEKIPLPSNSIDPVSGLNTGDNTGLGFPVIHITETNEPKLIIELMLLGSSSENLGRTYTLPDKELDAKDTLQGVRKCVLDAVIKAEGKGCPPYIIGVAIGPTRDRTTWLSKQQLRRKLDDINPVGKLAELEASLLEEVNSLGIGPKKLGGKTTALGLKIGANHVHPSGYYVDVTLLCWNTRRAMLIL